MSSVLNARRLTCMAGVIVSFVGSVAVHALADTTSSSRSTRVRPAPWAAIRHAMHRTYEVGPAAYADRRFASISRREVVFDGRGGSLTAVIGLRQPSADAKGQLVFFFHNRRFLGWDSNRKSIAIYGPRAPDRVASGSNTSTTDGTTPCAARRSRR